jgi:hypothetical protein
MIRLRVVVVDYIYTFYNSKNGLLLWSDISVTWPGIAIVHQLMLKKEKKRLTSFYT